MIRAVIAEMEVEHLNQLLNEQLVLLGHCFHLLMDVQLCNMVQVQH